MVYINKMGRFFHFRKKRVSNSLNRPTITDDYKVIRGEDIGEILHNIGRARDYLIPGNKTALIDHGHIQSSRCKPLR